MCVLALQNSDGTDCEPIVDFAVALMRRYVGPDQGSYLKNAAEAAGELALKAVPAIA